MERVLQNTNGSARSILGMRVDHTTYADAARRVVELSRNGGDYVCVATVHMVMEGHDNGKFLGVVNNAALVTPDGMPLVWALKFLGIKNAERVYGPTLTPVVCQLAAENGVPVGFYGGNHETLTAMTRNLKAAFPALKIAYVFTPPYRALTREEDEQVVNTVRASGARILFVGLGCPKQERWMAEHADRISAVMLGVGAAFDFIAGIKPQAPRWMQNAGLEWLFRLASEPQRLWKRYLYHNPRFIYYFGRQLLGLDKYKNTEVKP